MHGDDPLGLGALGDIFGDDTYDDVLFGEPVDTDDAPPTAQTNYPTEHH